MALEGGGSRRAVTELLEADGLLLGTEAELGGGERVRLGHRVLGAVEAVPDELAEERVAHFSVDRDVALGVMVDHIDVVAFRVAGDVASWVNPRYQRRMRVEHRMNATEQGAAAAVNLLKGDVQPFAPLPYFWSDQYNVKIQVHGDLPDGAEAAIEEGSPADGKFVALYRKDGATTAVLGWNSPARLIRYRKLLLG